MSIPREGIERMLRAYNAYGFRLMRYTQEMLAGRDPFERLVRKANNFKRYRRQYARRGHRQ
jgi:hypothetical protein